MTKSLESEFKKIVDEHKSTIYSVCYMYSNDPDEVNDLFQETLVKVWQGLPSFKGNSSMKTYLAHHAQHLHLCRPQEEDEDRAADHGHQPV